MSQGLALGITVGSSNTVSVTASGGHRHVHVRPSMPDAGRIEIPESFLSRVGDPVDIRTMDGSTVRAADLVAAAIGRAVDDTGPAAATVCCYPAWWSQHTVEVQREALAAMALDHVALVPEPAAAMRWLARARESGHDGAMVVYDLGATGLTVSVARSGAMSGLLGEPVHSTAVAGAEFDLLTMRYVLAYAVGDKDFDPFDPVVEQELAALRIRCKIAKETLSKNTATMVPVRLPELGALDVRLVRDDVEELFRGPLLASTDLVREALRRAGLTAADLDGILLTGGGASIPLVTELLSTEFGVSVIAGADPAHLSAHGAALLAADLLDTTATDTDTALLAGRAEAGAGALAQHADSGTVALRSTGTVPAAHAADSAATDDPTAPTDEVGYAQYRTGTGERPALPPALPTEEPAAEGFRRWKRVAVIGAAAAVVAAVATGTLAMGVGTQSAPSNPAVTTSPATAAGALDTATPSDTAEAPGTTAAAKPVTGKQTGASQPAGNPAGAPSTTAAAGGGDQSARTAPAQSDSTAPQQNPTAEQTPAAQQPTEQPAQQQPTRQPVQQQPAPVQLPSIQKPELPDLPEVTVPTVPVTVPGLPKITQ